MYAPPLHSHADVHTPPPFIQIHTHLYTVMYMYTHILYTVMYMYTHILYTVMYMYIDILYTLM